MINREKYVDLSFQSPRGQIIKALIQANKSELNRMLKRYNQVDVDCERIIATMSWGIAIDHWSGNVIASSRVYLSVDQWLESLLFKEALKIKSI